MKSHKTWLITGCNGGLGAALAEEGLERGNRVVVSARKRETVESFERRFPGRALALALDVTDDTQIKAAVVCAEEQFGGVDVLFNNAAYTLNGALEEATSDEYRPLFDANVFGPLEIMRAVLPGMRKRHSGHIVNIGSIAAIVGIPGFGLYGATKAALILLSEALAKEVGPLGIKVTAVELGGHNTKAIEKTRFTALTIPDYAGTVGLVRRMTNETRRETLGDVKRAASAIITAVSDDNPPSRIPIGADAVQLIEIEIGNQRDQIAKWRKVSESSAGGRASATDN